MHHHRLHGIDLELNVPAPGWPVAVAADPESAWTVHVDAPCSGRPASPQPAEGLVDIIWGGDPDRTTVEIHGGPVPASSWYVVDHASRQVEVAHTADDVHGCLEILSRWIVPDLARRALGSVPLHGTCVALDGRAVVITGVSGRGKSTTTAALLDLGARFVGDEPVCVRKTEGSGAMLDPGAARLSVGPDLATSATRWGLHVDRTGADQTGKIALVDERAAPDAAPVGAVVVLGARRPCGELLELERLAPSEAFRALLAQRYARPNQDHNIRADFTGLAAVTSVTPVWHASFRDDLATLPAAVERLRDVLGQDA